MKARVMLIWYGAFVLPFLLSCGREVIFPGEQPEQNALVGVPCGASRCARGEACHYFSTNGPHCVGQEGVPQELLDDHGNASVECDGPEDCPTSQECARMQRATHDYSVMLLCTGQRDPSWEVVCHDAKDCPTSQPICKEVKTSYMGSYKMCKER